MVDHDLRRFRRPEPSVLRAVARALGDSHTVLDVATGPVSYAPPDGGRTTARTTDRMTARATTRTSAWATGALPDADDAFDAAVVTLDDDGSTDPEARFAEVRRVTRGPVVVVTRDPDRVRGSWLAEYAPEVVAADAGRYPRLDRIAAALGGTVETTLLPIPFTCVDGFSEAYYARPERLLDPAVRRADQAWDLVDDVTARRSVAALRTALESGEWDGRHGSLRVRPSCDGSLVLLRATPGPH